VLHEVVRVAQAAIHRPEPHPVHAKRRRDALQTLVALRRPTRAIYLSN
jgi:hypothetical protein